MKRIVVLGIWLYGIGSVLGSASGDRSEPSAGEDQGLERFRPSWQVGQQWVVETASRPLQAAGPLRALQAARTDRWRFVVRELTKLGDVPCFRLEVYHLDSGRQEWVAAVWVDQRSLAMREFQGAVRVGGRQRTITESYSFPTGQPAPVETPFPGLGITLPCFWADRTKGVQKFIYEAAAGSPGQKSPEQLGFLVEAEQQVVEPSPQPAAESPYANWVKNLHGAPLIEVRIRTPSGQCRQLWQQGKPWPIYWETASTVARLVE